MGYGISRLTLYAVLSAIEKDIKNFVVLYLDGQKDIPSLFNPDVINRAVRRMENELGFASEYSLESLLPYVDFGDLYSVINKNRRLLPDSFSQHIRKETKKLDSLVSIRNRVAHSRPLHFDDLSNVLDIGENLAKSKLANWENTRNTLKKLQQNPSFVLGLVFPIRDSSDPVKHNLPIPDFDETGYLGRARQVDELIKLCLGPYPVITIVGEGGIGKTALALKVVYDILDMPECPFEAIVWTSSKTTRLTPTEIVRIEGAISNSLGIFQSMSDELVGVASDNPLDEVIQYLKEFKILLIIDNLETVLDNRVTGFFKKLPNDSKVLITSRIGLGAFEYPYKLSSFSEKEALLFLRALTKIRGVDSLFKISNKKLVVYCNKMKKNPGFIKWFVSAIQAGSRPEDVLAKSDIFLEFCMSNVYSYLSKESKRILRSMLCLPRRYSQAELGYLNDINSLDLQRSIHELLRTNMVIMSSTPTGSSFESQYKLADLARHYLAIQHPINAKERTLFSKRNKQLVAAGEQIQAEQIWNPYSFYRLEMRSRSDLIIAKFLLDALKEAKRGNHEQAEKLLVEARRLAPEYFEVHRVAAVVKVQQGNYSAALTSYEAAIDLEPRSAPLRKWYGSFLLRYMNDVKSGLEQFQEAAKIDPESAEIKIEIALANLYLLQFENSIEILENIIGHSELNFLALRKAYDIYLQCFYRKADALIQQKDLFGSLKSLEKLLEIYSSCPAHLIDPRIKGTIKKAKDLTSHYAKSGNNKIREHAAVLIDAFSDALAQSSEIVLPASMSSDEMDMNIRKFGHITALKGSYGFIYADEGEKLFFHMSMLTNHQTWYNLRIDDKVSFVLGKDNQGRFLAKNVRLE